MRHLKCDRASQGQGKVNKNTSGVGKLVRSLVSFIRVRLLLKTAQKIGQLLTYAFWSCAKIVFNGGNERLRDGA